MFSFTYQLTFEDYTHFLAVVRKRRGNKTGKIRFIVLAALIAILLAVTVLPGKSPTELLSVETLFPLGFILLAFAVFNWRVVPKLWRKRFDAEELGTRPMEVRADDEKLRILQKGLETAIDWDRVEDFTQDDDYLYIWLGPIRGALVPRRVFASRQEADAFSEFVVMRMNGA